MRAAARDGRRHSGSIISTLLEAPPRKHPEVRGAENAPRLLWVQQIEPLPSVSVHVNAERVRRNALVPVHMMSQRVNAARLCCSSILACSLHPSICQGTTLGGLGGLCSPSSSAPFETWVPLKVSSCSECFQLHPWAFACLQQR